jgi:hypothetical protein
VIEGTGAFNIAYGRWHSCTLVTPTISYKKHLPPIQNENDLVDVKINLDVSKSTASESWILYFLHLSK